jgi:hypothetical protein
VYIDPSRPEVVRIKLNLASLVIKQRTEHKIEPLEHLVFNSSRKLHSLNHPSDLEVYI